MINRQRGNILSGYSRPAHQMQPNRMKISSPGFWRYQMMKTTGDLSKAYIHKSGHVICRKAILPTPSVWCLFNFSLVI